jgi:hypothetical protein
VWVTVRLIRLCGNIPPNMVLIVEFALDLARTTYSHVQQLGAFDFGLSCFGLTRCRSLTWPQASCAYCSRWCTMGSFRCAAPWKTRTAR